LGLRIGATADEVLRRYTSRELSEMIAFDRLEPIGDERADRRSAIIAALIANANRDRAVRPTPFTEDDFMAVQRPREQQPWQAMKQAAKAFAAGFGKKKG
jgi:hypothetical protein